MPKVEFFVGPAIELTSLKEYCRLLNVAYENGADRGGSMDWSDVQLALDKALDALGDEAHAFMEAAENDDFNNVDDDKIKIAFMPGTDVTNEVLSAARLVFAYRYPEYVKWEDVDLAWEHLGAETAPAPQVQA